MINHIIYKITEDSARSTIKENIEIYRINKLEKFKKIINSEELNIIKTYKIKNLIISTNNVISKCEKIFENIVELNSLLKTINDYPIILRENMFWKNHFIYEKIFYRAVQSLNIKKQFYALDNLNDIIQILDNLKKEILDRKSKEVKRCRNLIKNIENNYLHYLSPEIFNEFEELKDIFKINERNPLGFNNSWKIIRDLSSLIAQVKSVDFKMEILQSIDCFIKKFYGKNDYFYFSRKDTLNKIKENDFEKYYQKMILKLIKGN